MTGHGEKRIMPRVLEGTGISDAHNHDNDLARMNAEFEDSQRGKPLKALIGLVILIVVALVLARTDHHSQISAPPPSTATDSNGAHGTTGQAQPPRGN